MSFCCPTRVIVRIPFSPLAEARHRHQTCRTASRKWAECFLGEQICIEGAAGETFLWARLDRSKLDVFCWVSFDANGTSYAAALVVLSNGLFAVFMLLSYWYLKWSFRGPRCGRAYFPFLLSVSASVQLCIIIPDVLFPFFFPFSFLDHRVKPKCRKLCMWQVLWLCAVSLKYIFWVFFSSLSPSGFFFPCKDKICISITKNKSILLQQD